MAEKLKLEVITPYKKIVSEEVDEVTATGTLGEFGILPGHAPFLSSLRIGEFCYKKEGVGVCLAMNWGYLEVENNSVVVLVETAQEISVGKKQKQKKAKAELTSEEM